MDKVKPLKIEKVSGGGSQDNLYPHDLNPNEDGIEARGLIVQNDSSNDQDVVVSRDGAGNMTFKDGVAIGTKTLSDLLDTGSGLSEGDHESLRALIHFIDDGPAEGFASNAYKEVTGTTFPTSIVWYEDATKVDKIVEKSITWTGTQATTIEWRMYDEDGSTVLSTVTDTITYSGIYETSRTRVIS